MKLVFCILLLAASAGLVAAAACSEEQFNSCNSDAICDQSEDNTYQCSCPDYMLGNGYGAVSSDTTAGCSETGWALRVVVDGQAGGDAVKGVVGSCDGNDDTSSSRDACMSAFVMNHTFGKSSVNFLFYENTATALTEAQNALITAGYGVAGYQWAMPTTSNPSYILQQIPTGMEVTGVQFETETGNVVLDVDFNTGPRGYATFFLPYSLGSDTLSYDYDYDSISAIGDTYNALNFPCSIFGVDPSSPSPPVKATMCCFGEEFADSTPPTAADTLPSVSARTGGTGMLGLYRATDAFVTWATNDEFCVSGTAANPIDNQPDTATALGFWAVGQKFADMPDSLGITDLTAVDPYLGIFKAVIKLNERELRTKAGKLKGNVGVEHTVDFFLGWASFVAASTTALDSVPTQTAIQVEKTESFSVATYGEGYGSDSPLSYINLRLLSIYDEAAPTDPQSIATYIQVTFTLEQQFQLNPSQDLIPIDEVRVGQGTSFDKASMNDACSQWEGGSFANKDTVLSRLGQECAPVAAMCQNPTSAPDQFVSFNIPLGMAVPLEASDSSSKVFFEMVLQVQETSGTNDPNSGDPQRKATLRGVLLPLPGSNTFCAGAEGATGTADLADVVSIDIVIGTTSSADELSRLLMNSDLRPDQSTAALTPPDDFTMIPTDVIEAGLMTLVLKGDETFFQTKSGSELVLEDVITVHFMPLDEQATENPELDDVLALLRSGDDTDSRADFAEYPLNNAFYFTVDGAAQRAYLDPTPALLAVCPFNPPRLINGLPVAACVTRRDVFGRDFPHRNGASSTAMEICAGDGTCRTDTDSDESWFFDLLMGDRDNAPQYAEIIRSNWDLNGVYRRAYWINPGYGWTPTQTGGRAMFSLSQTLLVFALVSIDSGLVASSGRGNTGDGPFFNRRRMLLSTRSDASDALKAGEHGLAAGMFQFSTSLISAMASAFGVTPSYVATFDVQIQLTQTEACMDEGMRLEKLTQTLEDYAVGASSPLHTVQITRVVVNNTGLACIRRSVRGLKQSSAATADVTLLLVFAGVSPKISLDKLTTMAGIQSVVPRTVSDIIETTVSDDPLEPAPICAQGVDNCDTNAACTNTEGSFTCACNAGYTGSGTACEATITTPPATITTPPATPQVRMKLELPYTVEQFNDPEVTGGFKRGVATAAGTTADMVEVLSVTAKTVTRRRLLADAVDVDFAIKVASTADAQALQSSDKLSLASLNTALENENVEPVSAIVNAPIVELLPDTDSAAPRGVAAAARLSLLAATLTLCRHHFD